MAKCLLRLPEVIRRVGYSRPSIYRKIENNEFPAPVKLGNRAIAWTEDSIDAWIDSRTSSRPTHQETPEDVMTEAPKHCEECGLLLCVACGGCHEDDSQCSRAVWCNAHL